MPAGPEHWEPRAASEEPATNARQGLDDFIARRATGDETGFARGRDDSAVARARRQAAAQAVLGASPAPSQDLGSPGLGDTSARASARRRAHRSGTMRDMRDAAARYR